MSGETAPTRRFVCIHGHFYQPPRENPWLEAVEVQESAQPYHDWNERVTTEAYEPNAASRVLDGEGRIRDIINNYARISFNMGPTLLTWMEENRPRVYRAVLEADRESRRRFGGHGSALAQVYNHMILPLADRREKETQVRWGVLDFEHRFGREPEGMWLPETAVDLESLEVLAEHGIRFTVLDPRQARRFRPLDAAPDVPDSDPPRQDDAGEGDDPGTGDALPVDPRRPYLQRLPSGREIVLFFYDGPLARAVAFEDMLEDGSRFADRLVDRFGETPGAAQLVHIATDGETYGHHHRHGEMALSRALLSLEERDDVELTNYGAFLEDHPPEQEVEIREETSWSCAHGIERWRSDCGCSTGGEAEWDQAWRGPLRDALDQLRAAVRPLLDRTADEIFRDPADARNEYVRVLLDRSPENVDAFLARHLGERSSPPARTTAVRALHLLELERHLQLMYTSCGWFFHDLAGIETVQVLRYAARAIQLADRLFEADVETDFLETLARAESNQPAHGDGRHIYRQKVEPLVMDLADVACHHALVELLHPDGDDGRYYCYRVRAEDRSLHDPSAGEPGRSARRRPSGLDLTRAITGRYRVESQVTRARADLCVVAVDLGRFHVIARSVPWEGPSALGVLREEVEGALESLDAAELMRVLDRRVPGRSWTFRSLAREEQRTILEHTLGNRLSAWEGETRAAYRSTAGPARLARSLDVPLPGGLPSLLESGLEAGLRARLSDTPLDSRRVESLLADADALGIRLDGDRLRPLVQRRAEEIARDFAAEPAHLGRLRRLEDLVNLLDRLPLEIDRRPLQDHYVRVARSFLPELGSDDVTLPEEEREEWLDRFDRLGRALTVAPGLRRPGDDA